MKTCMYGWTGEGWLGGRQAVREAGSREVARGRQDDCG